MSEIRIDDHKLLYHPERVSRWLQAEGQWEGIRGIYPIYMEISPFGGCNFRCEFCAMDYLQYRSSRIEFPVLKRCLSTLAKKGVKSVLFAGEGEPLLYEELGQAFETCREAGLDSALVTNGSVRNPAGLKAAVLHGKWIKFSVNAGTPEAHASIHRCDGQAWDRVFENIETCVSLRSEHRSSCILGAQAVLLDQNKDTLIDLARRSKALGLDYLAVKPCSPRPRGGDNVSPVPSAAERLALARELAREETDTFKIVFRTASFESLDAGRKRYAECGATPVFWGYIRSTGEVFGCLDFLDDPRFRYGNIHENDFEGIWEGAGRRAGFEYMRKSHCLDSCRVNCRMNQANEYLWNLSNPGSHVNFI